MAYEFDSPDDIRSRAAASRAATPTAAAAPAAPAPVAGPSAPAPAPGIATPPLSAPAAPTMGARAVNLLKATPGAAVRAGGALQTAGNIAALATQGADAPLSAKVENATDAMIGAVTVANPVVGTGLNVANMAINAPLDYLKSKVESSAYGDVRGPATKAFQARQAAAATPAGNPALATEAAPAVAPATAVNAAGARKLLDRQIDGPAGATFQPPPLVAAPRQAPVGPLPTLNTGDGVSFPRALAELGAANAAYRDKQVQNKAGQVDFNNLLKAGSFNMSAIKDAANVQLAFSDDERKGIDTEIKTRTAEAQRLLASGQYEKGQESGLRILAGLEKGKYHPAIVYGAPDENGVQQKMTVAVRDDGTAVPLQIPGFNGPGGVAPKTVTKADFDTMSKKNGWSDAQTRKYIESQGFKVAS